ncbi:hypothetical protein DFJ73DRAFT_823706 [Zopfochytrium polystomum]|nr:hypothetical protein DFJ73DRAFT_823706 [Zopfochytrium polystomum]
MQSQQDPPAPLGAATPSASSTSLHTTPPRQSVQQQSTMSLSGGSSREISLPISPRSQPPQSYYQGLKRRWSCETCRRRKLKCDGNRPSCTFCVGKGTNCVYVGSRVRAEFDMEKKAKLDKEEQRLRRLAGIPETPSPTMNSPNVESFQPSRAVMQSMNKDSFYRSLRLRPQFVAMPFQARPNSSEREELILIENFFTKAPMISGMIHKRTYLLNYKTMPAYLRLAVCAAGSANLSNTDDKECEWYIHQALKRLEIALIEEPRLECLQALMILPATKTCCPATLHSEQMKDLALFLRLNIDPDYLPECAGLSWHEKETRRRCWWYLFMADHIVFTILRSKPVITRSISSVKPVCPERLWTSSKPPESLEKIYEIGQNVNDNPINWQVSLLEIFQRVFEVSRLVDDPRPNEDDPKRRLVELQVEADLTNWWDAVPPEFWAVKSEDSLFELMEDDPYHWHSLMELFFVYHGSVCLLMRRKALLHLQSLSSATTVSSPGGTAEWTVEELAKQVENEAAFKKAVASAESIATVITLLNRANTFWHRLPKSTVMFSMQACISLFIAQWVYSTTGSEESSDCDDGNGGEKPFAEWIDSYISFFYSMSGTRHVARLFHKFVERAKNRDWEYLDQLEGNSTLVLDEIGIPALYGNQPAVSPFGSSELLSPIISPTSTSGKYISPYVRVGEGISSTVREYIKTLKAARDIGQMLTPAPTPFIASDPNLSYMRDAFFPSLQQFSSPAESLVMPQMGWFSADDSISGAQGSVSNEGEHWNGFDSGAEGVERFLFESEGVASSSITPVESLSGNNSHSKESSLDSYSFGLFSEAVETFRLFDGDESVLESPVGTGAAGERDAMNLLDWLLSARTDAL